MKETEGLLSKKRVVVDVVAGVVFNGDHILIAQRPADKHMGGLWEFPGGKIDPGESNRQALTRELKEELSIVVDAARPFIKLTHHYEDKTVILDVWRVGSYRGNVVGNEGQQIRWVKVSAFGNYRFPEADRAVLNALQLPEIYPISVNPSETGGLGRYVTQFRQVVEQPEISLVQVRAKQLNKETLSRLLEQCNKIAQANNANIIVNEHFDLVKKYKLKGVHLTTKQMRQLDQRPLGREYWVGASCHSYPDIELAHGLDVDFIVLSPVNKTDTHPGFAAMGWENFKQLAEHCNVPVYALGGVGKEELPVAWRNGAHGVAGISGFWPK